MTLTIEIELDDAREVMYEDLAETFGEKTIKDTIEEQARDVLTHVYDNKEQYQAQQQMAQQQR